MVVPGDILMSIEGSRILSYQDLTQNLYHYNVGDSISALVYSDGRQQMLKLQLIEYRG